MSLSALGTFLLGLWTGEVIAFLLVYLGYCLDHTATEHPHA